MYVQNTLVLKSEWNPFVDLHSDGPGFRHIVSFFDGVTKGLTDTVRRKGHRPNLSYKDGREP